METIHVLVGTIAWIIVFHYVFRHLAKKHVSRSLLEYGIESNAIDKFVDGRSFFNIRSQFLEVESYLVEYIASRYEEHSDTLFEAIERNRSMSDRWSNIIVWAAITQDDYGFEEVEIGKIIFVQI